MSSLLKFGVITRLVSTSPVVYEVRLEDHRLLVVGHAQIRPHPAKTLKPGARLSLYEIDGMVKWANSGLAADEKEQELLTEKKKYRVTSFDTQASTISFADASGASIRMRLPQTNIIWSKIARGSEWEIEITHSTSGETKYTLLMPAQEKKSPDPATQGSQPAPKPGPAPDEGSRQKSDRGEKKQQRDERERVQAEEAGMDAGYFQARYREGHRHEIMTFLAEHLGDESLEWYRMSPAKAGVYSQPQKALRANVQDVVARIDGKKIEFYSHQARALDSIRTGRNLVVVTPTASGKTLCYNPAIFERLAGGDPSARALYVFPLNALLMDQKAKLDELVKGFKANGIDIKVEYLIGGRGAEERRRIARSNPQIVAINPEMLSWILQAEAKDWAAFFSGLQYVVLDEVHKYRSVLGLHMAGIIRRLLLQTRRLKAQPQFILSSATVNSPLELAERLTSLPAASFELISEKEDGSRQAAKHWVVANPDLHQTGYDGYLSAAAGIMVELLKASDKNSRSSPLNTIVFAKSKRDVNKIYNQVQENLRHLPHLKSKITKYTSSDLVVEEKQKIYEGLKSGDLLGVVSTNALEAGIDIGHLDACVIAGFPFTVMTMRQMAGRVGRQEEGLVVYIPSSIGAVDQYYRQNPNMLLEQTPEVFVVDPGNPYVARKHINAAALGMGSINTAELGIFGPKAPGIVQQALEDRAMMSRGDSFSGTRRDFSDTRDVYAIAGIRGQAQVPYVICRAGKTNCDLSAECFKTNTTRSCDSKVTVLDKLYAYRDCHPEAIYESMDGGLYRVEQFDDQLRRIQVESLRENSLERTFAEEDTAIQVTRLDDRKKELVEGGQLRLGDITVTQSFTGYFEYTLEPNRRCKKCRREYDDDILQCPICRRRTERFFNPSKKKHLDFPTPYTESGLQINTKTVACWMALPAKLEERLYPASPCKLPGDRNRVMAFLKGTLNLEAIHRKIRLTDVEKALLKSYHENAGRSLRARRPSQSESVLYPGIYGQCLLRLLREKLPESRALEVFQAATGYPVTDDLSQVCRDCRTSVLLPAMHTLEHTILMRYPSVALGDVNDLGAHTSLGHAETGAPTIFWFDSYEGGLGAAEKIFDFLPELLEASERTLSSCRCSTLEGCPNCTQISHCDNHIGSLTKFAARLLIALLRGKELDIPLEPFIYRSSFKTKFESSYASNEKSKREHGIGDEAPQYGYSQPSAPDPFQLLRLQKVAHDTVLNKAFEIRGGEIMDEVPPVSVVELSQAFESARRTLRPKIWDIRPNPDPYKTLQILPSASLPMAQKIYRVIALQVHPDRFTGDKAQATEMMQCVNEAFEKIKKDKGKGAKV